MQNPLLMIVLISFQILNSMSVLHKLHQSTYDSLEKAKGNINSRVGVFSTVFSPSMDESKGLKIFLDIVGMGFVLTAAPMWNSGVYIVLLSPLLIPLSNMGFIMLTTTHSA